MHIRRLVTAIILLAFVSSSLGCTSGGEDRPGSSACSALMRFNGSGYTRIIDGTDCPVVGSPVVALTLLVESGNVGICSGTIVHPRYVLTAAHCYAESSEGAIIDSSVQVQGFDYLVKNVTIHPKANIPQNDIAIVELEDEVPVAPVPLLLTKPTLPDAAISIFGYGFDEDDNFASLRSGEMRVTGITSQNVFARFSGDGSNICFGDSGGPALAKDDEGLLGIVGVTSFATTQGCTEDSFAAFANIQGNEILEFILDTVPEIETL